MSSRYVRAVDAFKRQLLARTLRQHHGNVTRAAQALGLHRTTVYKLAARLNLSLTVPRVPT